MQITLTDTIRTDFADSLSRMTDSLSVVTDSIQGALADSLFLTPPVDTLVTEEADIIRNASDVFPGNLLLSANGAGSAMASLGWGDSPINWGLITVFTVLFILYLGRLVELLPYLLAGVGRWKAVVNLEDSMGKMRDRNGVAVIMTIPFCLACSKAGLLPMNFLSGLSPGLRTIGVMAVFFAFFVLRAILIEIVGNGKASRDAFQISNRCAYNFFILATLVLVLAMGVMYFMNLDEQTIRKVSYYILGVFILINMVRRTQILSNTCNQFTAILYLCALEILPLAILIAAVMIF